MKKKAVAMLMVLVLLVSGAMFVSAQVSPSNTDNGSITMDAPYNPGIDMPWEFPVQLSPGGPPPSPPPTTPGGCTCGCIKEGPLPEAP